ncbi:DUF6430 domain-containing protein [Streptomyces sp. B21-108]|uniref:macro domain-containing protein n=1 Tax=Streptomyces sp. B21-108 TaxID=3039419 RepID=UPI002FF09EDE
MTTRHNLSQLLCTQRGWTLLSRNALGFFGLMSAVLQILLALWSSVKLSGDERWLILGLLLFTSLTFGFYKAWPRSIVSRQFDTPDICVTVQVGNLFDQPTHLVIGFPDTFDTDTTNNLVISQNSVQGQFQSVVYGNDLGRLDADLISALAGTHSVSSESRSNKSHGKLARYEVGTIATLGDPSRRYFCTAYTEMRNNLVVQSTVDSLWKSLDAVWEAVYVYGQRNPVSIPIIGSELARISCLNRESLLKMIILSFVARSRQSPVCKELRIMVHQKDYRHISMLEVDAFLRTL